MMRVDRRVVFALCAIVSVSFIVSASLTFTLTPMMEDLHLTSEQSDTVLAIPSLASLFVVFLAGRLGDRLGHRRIIIAFSAVFVAGGILTALATGIVVLTLGLVFAGAAATAIQIVVLGLLQTRFPSGHARVTAFTSYGMMFPLMYLIVPVLTGWLLLEVSWRVVTAGWVVAGMCVPVLALTMLPSGDRPGNVGELTTPILAGVTLAAAVESISMRHNYGFGSPRSVVFLIIAAVSLVAWIVATRKLRRPSVSFESLRTPGMKSLLAAVLVVAMACSLVFVTLGVQYLYSLTSLQAAIAMVPAELGAVLGAKMLASALMRRYRMATAIRVTLLAFAASMALLLLMYATCPIWLPVAIGTVFAVFGMAAITILNTEVMAHSTEQNAGMVSAFRGAASAIGGTLGVSILGAGIVDAAHKQDITGVANPDGLIRGFHYEGLLGALFVAVMLAWFVFGRDRVTQA